MRFVPSTLYYWMVQTYFENKTDDNKILFCNEGSSRSCKTWDAIHLIYTFCDHNRYLDVPLEIGVFRRTLKDSREKTYEKDFKPCLKTMQVYNSDDVRKENTSPDYYLFGNKIEFRGLDSGSESTAYDIIFVNEGLEVEDEELIAGLKMRCRKLMIFDWNPRYTLHWLFDYEDRPFTYFSKTTYKNNKHLEKSVIADIESKSPWHLDDLQLPEKDRRRHDINYQNRTVDEWYFKVYGMGVRANRDGLVYPDVTWVDEFPDYERIGYALDLGFTNSPTVLSKATVIGDDLFGECLIYTPTEKPKDLVVLLDALGLEKQIIWCDSAHPVFIGKLNKLGCRIFAIKKTPIMDGVGLVKEYNIHLIKNIDVQKEQENYSMRKINGIPLDEPVKKHDHWWDSLRYNVMANFRNIN